MRPILIFFLVVSSFSSSAQNNTPRISITGNQLKDFVPAGWKIMDSSRGDLNKDNLPDLALIIENTDPRNFVANIDRMGGDTFNVNPRILLVLFKDKQAAGYTLVAQNQSFMPPPNDTVSTCLADPLGESEGLKIQGGLFELHFQYWMSCGSWFTSNHSYLFRYQNGQFELIGFDSNEFHRSSGEMSDVSINFSTRKLSHTTGGNMFEETTKKPTTTWKKFSLSKMMTLKSMDGHTFDQILKIMEQ